jgi:hypothetical protein
MNNVITRTLGMFVRVDAFHAERAQAFPADSLGSQQFAIVAETIQHLNEALTTQTSGLSSVQQATASRAEASERLRDDMQAVARTARVMAEDTPGLENKFRLPRSGSDQALLIAARAFITDAIPLKDEFLRHELHPTFIEDMQADMADLERAMGVQNTGRDTHVTATASIDSVFGRGMKAARRLDAIVRNKYRNDPATLAAWESARHVERAARTPRRSNGGAADKKTDGGDKS